jgi:hypothetical protein
MKPSIHFLPAILSLAAHLHDFLGNFEDRLEKFQAVEQALLVLLP